MSSVTVRCSVTTALNRRTRSAGTTRSWMTGSSRCRTTSSNGWSLAAWAAPWSSGSPTGSAAAGTSSRRTSSRRTGIVRVRYSVTTYLRSRSRRRRLRTPTCSSSTDRDHLNRTLPRQPRDRRAGGSCPGGLADRLGRRGRHAGRARHGGLGTEAAVGDRAAVVVQPVVGGQDDLVVGTELLVGLEARRLLDEGLGVGDPDLVVGLHGMGQGHEGLGVGEPAGVDQRPGRQAGGPIKIEGGDGADRGRVLVDHDHVAPARSPLTTVAPD